MEKKKKNRSRYSERNDNADVSPEENLDYIKEERLRRREAARKRVIRNRIILVCVILLIIGSILFRFLVVAKKINVENSSPYDSDKVLSSMNVGYGSFLYSFDADKIEADLEGIYPYIKKVEVKYSFPTTVNLKIVGEEKKYSISLGGKGYLCTNEEFKVLEKTSSPVVNTTVIEGTDFEKYTIGQVLNPSDFLYTEIIEKIISECERIGIKKISAFDMTKKYGMKILVGNGVEINVGDGHDLDKKFNTLKVVIDENGLEKPAKISVENYRQATYSLIPEEIETPPAEEDEKVETDFDKETDSRE